MSSFKKYFNYKFHCKCTHLDKRRRKEKKKSSSSSRSSFSHFSLSFFFSFFLLSAPQKEEHSRVQTNCTLAIFLAGI